MRNGGAVPCYACCEPQAKVLKYIEYCSLIRQNKSKIPYGKKTKPPPTPTNRASLEPSFSRHPHPPSSEPQTSSLSLSCITSSGKRTSSFEIDRCQLYLDATMSEKRKLPLARSRAGTQRTRGSNSGRVGFLFGPANERHQAISAHGRSRRRHA